MANSDDSCKRPVPLILDVKQRLQHGGVIPAHPLALNANRKLDERYQRALSRYYLDSGAIGLAVGVHTTQFQIRDPRHGLYKSVLALAAEEMNRAESSAADARDTDSTGANPLVRVAGICGQTRQAVLESQTARDLGYHFGLLNLGALKGCSVAELIDHCRAVAEQIDLFGFYLQPSVGGIELPFAFWQAFCEIEAVAAIKVAAFNRYQTIDVVRAVSQSGRDDIALYTGNDDNIVPDLLTEYCFQDGQSRRSRRFVGGLLGQWAVWTSEAVELQQRCRRQAERQQVDGELLTLGIELTDANAAIFDVANQFKGCIAGIHEILRRQGLLPGIWCLDANETLGPGQAEQIDRVLTAYPHLSDDAFVAANRDRWLSG